MKDLRKFIRITLKEYQLLKENKEKLNELLKLLLELLSKYSLERSDFAIFGSAPLVVTGVIDSVNDLDVIIRPSEWPFESKGEFRTDYIEFFDNWPEFDIDDLIDNHTFEYNGFLFVNPEKVIEYKTKMRRYKDKNIWRK